MNKNDPYLLIEKTIIEKKYNPDYGDDRLCECDHQYYRHFDTYDNMEPIGCKYCSCSNFIETKYPEVTQKISRKSRLKNDLLYEARFMCGINKTAQEEVSTIERELLGMCRTVHGDARLQYPTKEEMEAMEERAKNRITGE